jgi:hypothetical protein
MSSYRNNRKSYVPKWKQAEEEAKKAAETAAKALEDNEINFPRLGGGAVRASTWSGRKFTELAKDWNDEEERKKVVAEAEKAETLHYPEIVLPKFNNVGRHTDDYYDDEEEEEEKPEQTSEETEDGEPDGEWVTVRHKRPPREKGLKKSAEIQALTEEDFKSDSDKEGETVWGGEPKESHETCWEGRHP